MKQLTIKAILTLASLFAALPAFASPAVRVDVPFTFTVGYDLMPSGSYIISRDPWGVVKIQSLDRSKVVSYVSSIVDPNSLSGDKLIFHKYGDRYFLGRVSTSSFSVRVPVSNTEKSLQPRGGENPNSAAWK